MPAADLSARAQRKLLRRAENDRLAAEAPAWRKAPKGALSTGHDRPIDRAAALVKTKDRSR